MPRTGTALTGNSNGGLQWVNAATGGVIDISNHGYVTQDGLASSSHDSGTYLHRVQERRQG